MIGMKSRRYLISIFWVIATVMTLTAADKLPKVEILGKEYYYHEIRKGESVYGIAKQHGWDLEELVRLNPHATSEMKKGERLYYPTGKVTVIAVPDKEVDIDTISYEPIRHVVKKGETVYSIASQYNVPLDVIYAAYPKAKYGIKAGETIVINQSPETIIDNKYLYYVVKPGDTLFSLARKYHTSIEDIMKLNPTVSEKNFKIGDTVRIFVNSNSMRIRTELVEEERLASLDNYKVGKDDTWESISRKTGVDEETLREANSDTRKLKKNGVIAVPKMETVQVEKKFGHEDPRELTTEGIQELYDSLHNTDSETNLLAEVRIAVVLDDPASNRDLDFSRGLLMAIDEMKKSPYRICLKLIDGRGAAQSVMDTLDLYEPNIILATADKNFPAFLADYGDENNIEVVNVFDVKSILYYDNASIVQLLLPSSYFNEQIADFIAGEYAGCKMITTGTKDSNDGIAEILLPKMNADDAPNVNVSDLSDLTLNETDRYLLYAYPNKKEEIADILLAVENLKERYPMLSLTVIGRPSWVTLTETLGDKFGEAEVVVPSRVWFDSQSASGEKFNRKFSEMFDGVPVKSFPGFAASGYDVAKYFIPAVAATRGDFNNPLPEIDSDFVQVDIRLQRANNWGGFINPVSYMLKYLHGGYVDKQIIR